ncbi:hypothetical protein NX059_009576 [Plenodomus lindquistii]|nr:hypothetical protein NX059_009576 [Plenodomus lindquistii]
MPPKKLNKPSQPELSADELESLAQNTSSPESKLQEAASKAEAALAASKQASSLRSAAETIKDPAKREKYLKDAYNKEIEAHGNSKKARILSSGAFQGSVGGGGIGMAVGAGLGTVVGTVVGTVATIPTTALGTLVGAGVGGVHGPWVKLGKMGGGDKDQEKEGEKKGDDEGGEKEGDDDVEGLDDKVEQGQQVLEEDAVPDPQALREAADKVAAARKQDSAQKEKKKPRKLEVRNKQATATASG